MKSIFTFSACLLAAVSAMAVQKPTATVDPAAAWSWQPATQAQGSVNAPMVAGGTDDGYNIRFCDSVEGYIGYGSECQYELYIEVDADLATRLAGNVITTICISAGFTGEAEVFVDEDTETISSTTVTMTNNAAMLVGGMGYTQYKLEEPYTIKENTTFQFGFRATCSASQYPIGLCNVSNDFGGYINFKPSGYPYWYQYTAASMGVNNLSIYAITEGDVKALDNFYTLSTPAAMFTLSMVEQGDPTYFRLPVINYGDNDLTTITYSISQDGGEYVTKTADINVPALTLSQDTILLSTPDLAEIGATKMTLRVETLNGVEADLAEKTMRVMVSPVGKAYSPKMVVEEGTGMWCGYCPRGIVAMEYMKENYPENYIGIAIHNGDIYQPSSYNSFVNKYFSSYPSCIVNRDALYLTDPNDENLDMLMGYFMKQKPFADVQLEFNQMSYDSGGKLCYDVTTTTTFAFDMDDAKYKIALVTLEDGLPGEQTNYFSQEAGSIVSLNDWWDSAPYSVEWTYDEVARGIYSNCYGITNSVPVTVEADTPYYYSYSVPASNFGVTANGADVPDNTTYVVALLLDTATGVIVNASRVQVTQSGLSTVTVAPAAGTNAIEYYNLQGQRVASPASGQVYLMRQGSSVTKVIL